MRLAAPFLSVLLIVLVVACSNNSKPSTQNNSNTLVVEENEGLLLMEQNCYACHNPNAKSHDELLAPPFAAIKRRYSKEYDNQNDFVAAIVNYATSPDSNKALMRGAINEFGLMPALPIGKDKLSEIANYLYKNRPEEPEWFQEHFKEMHGKGKH
jgi:mono/diheme cytochrome c family protein